MVVADCGLTAILVKLEWPAPQPLRKNPAIKRNSKYFIVTPATEMPRGQGKVGPSLSLLLHSPLEREKTESDLGVTLDPLVEFVVGIRRLVDVNAVTDDLARLCPPVHN